MIFFKPFQECTGNNSSIMICDTPPIDLNDIAGNKRRRRRYADNLHPERHLLIRRQRDTGSNPNTNSNGYLNLLVEISFYLDGVLTYRDLTNTSVEDFEELNVLYQLEIEPFDPITTIFTPIWPVKDRTITIKVSVFIFIILCSIQSD